MVVVALVVLFSVLGTFYMTRWLTLAEHENEVVDLLYKNGELSRICSLRASERDDLKGEVAELQDELIETTAGLATALADLGDGTRERDAILRWSIERAGYIGTTGGGPCKWWALGLDGRRVYANTPENVVRIAAGLQEQPEVEGGVS